MFKYDYSKQSNGYILEFTWKSRPYENYFSTIKTMTQYIRRNNLQNYRTYQLENGIITPFIVHGTTKYTWKKINQIIQQFEKMHKRYSSLHEYNESIQTSSAVEAIPPSKIRKKEAPGASQQPVLISSK